MEFKTSETYETWAPEDIEAGDTDDRGFIFEDQYYTLRELVRLMRDAGYCYASSTMIDAHTWFSTDKYDEDYRTGAIEYRSIHIDMSARNKRRLAKIMNQTTRYNRLLHIARHITSHQIQQLHGNSNTMANQ